MREGGSFEPGWSERLQPGFFASHLAGCLLARHATGQVGQLAPGGVFR
jgi:hypothetical protein